ncbi:MAG: hypothetical protein IT581_15185 [Verrucomicrobiales bacterium]|nr:hypothetical protein [Verrucomicrobiales bacterium]
MDDKDARNLSNDFQDVHLYSLHRWSEASVIVPSGSHGPYVILQTAIDPEDPSAAVDDFILGKDGRWLPLYLFHPLPKEVRRQHYLYLSAAEAITVLGTLTGKPAIERGKPKAEVAHSGQVAVNDPLNAAIAEAVAAGPVDPPET